MLTRYILVIVGTIGLIVGIDYAWWVFCGCIAVALCVRRD